MRFRPALLVLGLVVAACGGGGDASDGVASLSDLEETPITGDATPAAGVDEEAKLLEFSACMRAEGLDFDDPTVDADGNVSFPIPEEISQEVIDELQVAADACAEHLEGVTFGFTAADLSALQDQLLLFAQCIRDNGYDLEDPDFSFLAGPGGTEGPGDTEGPGGIGPFRSLNIEDPAFLAVLPACQDILAAIGIGGSTNVGSG